MANYHSGPEFFDSWAADLLHGEPPERWSCGGGALADAITLGPGQVVLLGGAPGQGKTALTMQLAFDSLRMNHDLRALIVNVEMEPSDLFSRELARTTGLPLSDIQSRGFRRYSDAGIERLSHGLAELKTLSDRIGFLRPPFSILRLADAADSFNAPLVVADYVQRLVPVREQATQREALESMASDFRLMAKGGACVLAVSAVARQGGSKGSTYTGLNLASFRGSSELEFAADSCYLLAPEQHDAPEGCVRLSCAKRRHGAPVDVVLNFERQFQRFTPIVVPAHAQGCTYDN